MTTGHRILGLGLAIAVAWVSGTSALFLSSDYLLTGHSAIWAGFAATQVICGAILAIGFYFLANLGIRKKPQFMFRMLVVSDVICMLVFLAMTVAFAVISIRELNALSMDLSVLLLPVVPGGAFVLLLSSVIIGFFGRANSRCE